MLNDEQKVNIAKKVAEAAACNRNDVSELLGPSYEGVCKACDVCTSTSDEYIEIVALGYARRYVRRQKFGSRFEDRYADGRAKWNLTEPDKRDQNCFVFHEFRPLDLLYLLVDLPKCLSVLTEDELEVVRRLSVLDRTNFNRVAIDLKINHRTVQSRWESALEKMRKMMGVNL